MPSVISVAIVGYASFEGILYLVYFAIPELVWHREYFVKRAQTLESDSSEFVSWLYHLLVLWPKTDSLVSYTSVF